MFKKISKLKVLKENEKKKNNYERSKKQEQEKLVK
jgi:hypothetical protein